MNSITNHTPPVNRLPILRLQRRGDSYQLVLPAEQRHQVNTYPITRRRRYSALEPVYTPRPVVTLSREQAQAIVTALGGDQVHSYEPGDLWFHADAGDVLATLVNDRTHVSDQYPLLPPTDPAPNYAHEHPDYLRLESWEVL